MARAGLSADTVNVHFWRFDTRTRHFPSLLTPQADAVAHRLCSGNPLAVLVDAQDPGDESTQRIARWTNRSVTSFLLPPTPLKAEYPVHIFTLRQERAFARSRSGRWRSSEGGVGSATAAGNAQPSRRVSQTAPPLDPRWLACTVCTGVGHPPGSQEVSRAEHFPPPLRGTRLVASVRNFPGGDTG
ncbi:MAG: PhzF family phenazine biosynthesis protein [Rhodanobacter sp.]